MVVVPTLTRHLIDRGDGAKVELFQAQARSKMPTGAILFVHGNQGGRLLGAIDIVNKGVLLRFCLGLNITAAAVSQPGFGASDGPLDFCGPSTQQAIIAALAFLKTQSQVDPERIALYGNSRGAIASAMVATQVSDLRAVILASGIYDLEAAFESSSQGLRLAIESEAGVSSKDFLVRSALRHVHKIQSETVLLHGRSDDRAPVAQAELFSEALLDVCLPVTLRVFECGHDIPKEFVQLALRPILKRIFDTNKTYN